MARAYVKNIGSRLRKIADVPMFVEFDTVADAKKHISKMKGIAKRRRVFYRHELYKFYNGRKEFVRITKKYE